MIVILRETGCGGRWWRRRAFCARGRTAQSRTAKSCGPDAPLLASSAREARASAGDGDNKARSPGRARRKP